MRYAGRTAAGKGRASARRRHAGCRRLLLLPLAVVLAVPLVSAQSLYKFRGPDGELIYSDRPPPGDAPVEVRELERGLDVPEIDVFHRVDGPAIKLYAKSSYHAPVELILGLDELRNVSLPPPDQSMRFILEPRSDTLLLSFDVEDQVAAPMIAYRYRYLAGHPEAEHIPEQPYRAPFAVAGRYVVSQAYPYATTHTTADAYHAVDIAMPIGTHVYAAREGTVFEVASTNFRGGDDPDADADHANLVRILHDDGTYAVYAHLNWNSIRVEPGDRVLRGEYIADSGNTGFTTGPHLHFAVIRNAGMRPESVPVVFEGPNGTGVEPQLGETLVAY